MQKEDKLQNWHISSAFLNLQEVPMKFINPNIFTTQSHKVLQEPRFENLVSVI